MKKAKVSEFTKCPICDREYTSSEERGKTKHHIFPRYWYKNSSIPAGKARDVTVKVCRECHDEFNDLYPMKLDSPWSMSVCLNNWIEFGWRKSKNVFKVYPNLLKMILG